VFATGGCAAPPRSAPKPPPATRGTDNGKQPIAPAELDELTRAFADRYVGLLSSACEPLLSGIFV